MVYRIIEILGNRYAGFILCLIVVINLAVGSVVMNMNPDIYPPFFPFDLNFFFNPVMAVHGWLYALLVTFSLFAVNMVACFIESIVRLANTTGNKLRLYVGLFIHGALILTMAAHVYDGFYGNSGQATLTPEATPIAGIGNVSALSVTNIPHPDGSLKDTEATLQFELDDGNTIKETIAYNEPATFEGGQREVIIQGGDNQPAGVILIRKHDGKEFAMRPYKPQEVADGRLTLRGVYQSQMNVLIAQFVWEQVGQEPQLLSMALDQTMARHNKISVANEVFGYKEMLQVPVVAVMTRYNPAIPIILLSLLTATIGTLLQIRLAGLQSRRTSLPGT